MGYYSTIKKKKIIDSHPNMDEFSTHFARKTLGPKATYYNFSFIWHSPKGSTTDKENKL